MRRDVFPWERGHPARDNHANNQTRLFRGQDARAPSGPCRVALLALLMFSGACPFAMAQTADASTRTDASASTSTDADASTSTNTDASASAGTGDETRPSARSSARPSAAQIAGVALPSAMVLYGALSLTSGGIRKFDYQTRGEILEDGQVWHTTADNYLQFAPAAAAYVLKFTGVQSKNSLLDMTLMYGLANAVQASVVTVTKSLAHRERPDGSNNLSFPSGHTATAFVAAEFLHQEYGCKSVWIDIAGYGVAAWVGAARVCKNRHWLSDVVAGAGAGILTTKGVYWAYPRLKMKWFGTRGRGEVVRFAPVLEYNGGGANLAFVCRF